MKLIQKLHLPCSLVMKKFVVRNNAKFVQYVQFAWQYFLNNDINGVKIIIRKDSVFLHIDCAYCVILNDLKVLMRRNKLEASKKSIEWLKKYDV